MPREDYSTSQLRSADLDRIVEAARSQAACRGLSHLIALVVMQFEPDQWCGHSGPRQVDVAWPSREQLSELPPGSFLRVGDNPLGDERGTSTVARFRQFDRALLSF